jgi:asparagine synthase (glutamine-hydrolysing)
LLDDHVSGRADHGHRLWCLLMLELWQREHIDAAATAAVAA